MTALGVCQQGKLLESPPRLQTSIRFPVVTEKIKNAKKNYLNSGPVSVAVPGVRPRWEYA